MIGDNLESDIKFGNTCGIDTLLVLSGSTSEEKAKDVMLRRKIQPNEGHPTYVSPCLFKVENPELLRDQN